MTVGLNKIKAVSAWIIAVCLMAWAQQGNASELQRYFEQARTQNPKLLINRTQYQVNQAQHRIARSALMPNLSLSAVAKHSDGGLSSSVKNGNQVYTIKFTQAIFDGSVWHRLGQAKNQVEQGRISVELALEQLMLQVAQSYVNIVLAQTQLQLADQEAKANKQLADRSENLYRVGSGKKVDYLQAKAAYQLSKSTLLSRKNELSNNRLKLQAIIGGPVDKVSPIEIDETYISNAQQTLKSALNQAMSDNLNLQQLRVAVLSAKSNEAAVQWKLWPNVSFSASHVATQYDSQTSSLINNDKLSLALTMNWVLFDGLGNYARLDEARLQQRISAFNIDEFINNLEQQVEQLIGRIETALEQVPALEALVLARENEYAATSEGFSVGVIELSEVINVQNRLTSAKLDLNQARLKLWLDHLQLKQVMGQLSVEDLKTADR